VPHFLPFTGVLSFSNSTTSHMREGVCCYVSERFQCANTSLGDHIRTGESILRQRPRMKEVRYRIRGREVVSSIRDEAME
jgi:hypothetical protein